MRDYCDKATIPWLGAHTMRLERVEGDREHWRCVKCGRDEIREFPFRRKVDVKEGR